MLIKLTAQVFFGACSAVSSSSAAVAPVSMMVVPTLPVSTTAVTTFAVSSMISAAAA
jgi:hypothetical protein